MLPASPRSQSLGSVLVRPSWHQPDLCLPLRNGNLAISCHLEQHVTVSLVFPHSLMLLEHSQSHMHSLDPAQPAILTCRPTPGWEVRAITRNLFRVLRTMIQVPILKLILQTKNAGLVNQGELSKLGIFGNYDILGKTLKFPCWGSFLPHKQSRFVAILFIISTDRTHYL